VAVITEEPAATPVARPVVSIVAAATVAEFHVATEVKSCVLLSEYVPVAVNCCFCPAAMAAAAGVTAMLDNVAVVTVSGALPEIAPEVAVIFADPTATAVARPVLFTVATAAELEVHVAVAEMFCVVPSEKCAVAVNCCVPAG